ncbi:MAG: ABC transporter ATP-binding protein, partial [Bacteroidales bacterium]
MKNFRRLLGFAKPHSKYWAKYLPLTILAMVFGIANFMLIIPLLNIIFDSNNIDAITTLPNFSFSMDFVKHFFGYYLYSIKIEYGVMWALSFICVSIILASMLSNTFKYFSYMVLVSMRVRVMENIRRVLYEKITKLHIGFFNHQRKGNLLSVLSNDVSEVQNSTVFSFQVAFREPIMIIGNLAVLFYMSYQLTIITLIALPISAYFVSLIAKKLKRKASDTQRLQGDIMSMVEETISGARIIKAFNAQQYVRRSFAQINIAHRNSSQSVARRIDLASPMSEFLGITIAMAILFFGGMMIISGNSSLTVPEFIAYLAFYYQLLRPIKELSGCLASIQRGMASAERIFDILDMPINIKKIDKPISFSSFKQQIEFRDVGFCYDKEPVLQNMNLTIPKGKMYALVGASGAGKTTLADLIPRFYDVTSGSIFIDGIDLRKYQPKDIITQMGVVTQEAILFNDTVRNNIAFGLEGISEEAVIEAAKIANAHNFIAKMEQGYSTNIGDRGCRLSGGQRQRIAIARAVLKNPPILILDEATSALDTESEKLVQDALTNLMKNRTSIVIAHRLSTIRHA